MARPLKDGADYFPKDIDFYTDDKVRLLKAEFGAKGMYLLDYLLCEIYKNGYYIQWDEDKCALVSEGAGCACSPKLVDEVVNGCIRRSFFNKRVFDMFGVLTSSGIQRRFVRMLNQRTKYTFISEYFLLDVNDTDDVPEGILNKLTFKNIINIENEVKSNENPVIINENAQSKVNNNKVQDNIVNNNKAYSEAAVLIRKTYETNIGFLSPKVAETLYSWLDSVDVSLIIYAIEAAVEYGAKKPAYIYAILQNQFNNGCTTKEQAIEAEHQKKEKSTRRKNAFQDYNSDGYEYELEQIKKQMGDSI